MTGGDRTPNRLALVVIAVLGLLAAAVALPATGGVPLEGDPTLELGGGDEEPRGDDGGGGVLIRPPLELIELLFRLLGIIDVQTVDGPPPAYNVSVEPQPIPGRVVTVTVARRGEPVEGARVAFNGRPIGRTDAAGQVSGEVPYDRELVVTVTPPESGGGTASNLDAARTDVDEPHTSAYVAPDRRGGSLVAAGPGGGAPIALAGQTTEAPNGTPENASESFVIDDPVAIRLSGSPDPGETVELAASIAEVPMRDARVTVNGEAVGRTDDAGRYTLQIPDDGTERLEVRVVRGDFAGSRTVRVRLLQASVEPNTLVAVPGGPATVTATIAGEPAAGAVVELDGRRLGTTGSDGGLRFDLPLDPGATVTVRAADQTATAGLLGLYAVTGGLGAAALVAIGAVLTVVGRRTALPADLGRTASNAIDRLLRAAVRAAVRIADWLHWLLRRAGLALGWAWRTGLELARGLVGVLRGGVGDAWERLRRLPGRARELASLVALWLRSAPGRLLAWYRSRNRDRVAAQAAAGAGPSRSAADPGLRELWRAFARQVLPAEWPRRTPGEVARAAVDRGFPTGAVDTVTAAFRDAEYGGEAIQGERLGRVREAFERLVDRRAERSGDGPGEGSDP